MITRAQAVALVFLLGVCAAGFGSVPGKTEVPAPAEGEIIEAVVLEDRGGYAFITLKIRVEKANPRSKRLKGSSEMEVAMRSYSDTPPLGETCLMEIEPTKGSNGTAWVIKKWWLKAKK